MTATSTALVPVPVASAHSEGIAGHRVQQNRMMNRKKWLLAAAVSLVVAGLALGSAVLGFAAILPLLFILPCLAMCVTGMCKGSGDTSGDASEV